MMMMMVLPALLASNTSFCFAHILVQKGNICDGDDDIDDDDDHVDDDDDDLEDDDDCTTWHTDQLLSSPLTTRRLLPPPSRTPVLFGFKWNYIMVEPSLQFLVLVFGEVEI